MKTTFYDLFAEDTPQRAPSEGAIRTRTLARIEAEGGARRAVHPVRRALLAAAAVAVLVGGAVAAPAIYSAVKGVTAKQSGQAAVQILGSTTVARDGILEITLEIDVNADAPETIRRYYLPAQAADWTPAPLYYTTPEAPDFAEDFFGAWTLPDGSVLKLWQYTLRHYSPEVSYDTVSLGYGADYALSERELGGLALQCVAVPPSQLVAENGQILTDEGRQKLYWSDGDYLFVLEVPYETDEQTLDAILSGLMPVEDVSPYVRLEYYEVTVPDQAPLDVLLFPTEVPEGWTLVQNSGPESESSCTWIWTRADQLSGLELAEIGGTDAYGDVLLSWLGEMQDTVRRETTVGDWQITVLETDCASALLWTDGGTTFYLNTKGEERLSTEALLALAASLAPLG